MRSDGMLLIEQVYRESPMSQKTNKKANPNKNNKKKQPKGPEIHCPKCQSVHLTYEPDARRIPVNKWITVAAVIAIVVFFFTGLPYFSMAFAVAYFYFLFKKTKVVVGTCRDCGEETLFNPSKEDPTKPKPYDPFDPDNRVFRV